jgi:diguanylate cyclase
MLSLIGFLDLWAIKIPVPVALAIVATIGYLFGRRTRQANKALANHSRSEMRRAQFVAAELEKISSEIQKNLAKHHATVTRFKDRLNKVSDQHDEMAWKELCREAEEMLKPTLKLASQMANAYDEIRQQSANLMTFTEARTDPLTSVKNRRGLNDSIQAQFALLSRYDTPFSLVMLDIDHFKRINDEHGHLHGDRALQELAQVLDGVVRETDIVSRYGGDEFVVVMPQTDLENACILSERLRAIVQQKISVTISGGVSTAQKNDTQDTLLSRADAALYQAKTSGRNGIYRNDALQITQVAEEALLDLAN